MPPNNNEFPKVVNTNNAVALNLNSISNNSSSSNSSSIGSTGLLLVPTLTTISNTNSSLLSSPSTITNLINLNSSANSTPNNRSYFSQTLLSSEESYASGRVVGDIEFQLATGSPNSHNESSADELIESGDELDIDMDDILRNVNLPSGGVGPETAMVNTANTLMDDMMFDIDLKVIDAGADSTLLTDTTNSNNNINNQSTAGHSTYAPFPAGVVVKQENIFSNDDSSSYSCGSGNDKPVCLFRYFFVSIIF